MDNPPGSEISTLLDDDSDTCLTFPLSGVTYKDSIRISHSANGGAITILETVKDVMNCNSTGLFLYTDSGYQCRGITMCNMVTSSPVNSSCSVHCQCPPPSCVVNMTVLQDHLSQTWSLCAKTSEESIIWWILVYMKMLSVFQSLFYVSWFSEVHQMDKGAW